MGEDSTDGEGLPDIAEHPAIEEENRHGAKTLGKKKYTVGYGKPPKATQFAPGMSGNPKGRPKVWLSTAAILSKELSAKIEVTMGGKREKVTKETFIIRSTVNDAVRGDKPSRKEVFRMREKHPERDAPQAQGPNYGAMLRDKIERMAERFEEQREQEKRGER